MAGQTFQVLPESSAHNYSGCRVSPFRTHSATLSSASASQSNSASAPGSPTPTPNNTGGNTNGGGGSQGCGTLPEQTPCPEKSRSQTWISSTISLWSRSAEVGPAGRVDRLDFRRGGWSSQEVRAYSAGTYNLPWSEILRGIEPGAYGTVRVAQGGVAAQNTPTVKFYVLADTGTPQYNTPVEAMCSGAPATAYRQDLGPKVCNNWSAATPISVKLDFRQKVLLNGHGYSIDDGF